MNRIPMNCHYCGAETMLRQRMGYSQLQKPACLKCQILSDNLWAQEYLEAALELAELDADVTIWQFAPEVIYKLDAGRTDLFPVRGDDGLLYFE